MKKVLPKKTVFLGDEDTPKVKPAPKKPVSKPKTTMIGDSSDDEATPAEEPPKSKVVAKKTKVIGDSSEDEKPAPAAKPVEKKKTKCIGDSSSEDEKTSIAPPKKDLFSKPTPKKVTPAPVVKPTPKPAKHVPATKVFGDEVDTPNERPADIKKVKKTVILGDSSSNDESNPNISEPSKPAPKKQEVKMIGDSSGDEVTPVRPQGPSITVTVEEPEKKETKEEKEDIALPHITDGGAKQAKKKSLLEGDFKNSLNMMLAGNLKNMMKPRQSAYQPKSKVKIGIMEDSDSASDEEESKRPQHLSMEFLEMDKPRMRKNTARRPQSKNIDDFLQE